MKDYQDHYVQGVVSKLISNQQSGWLIFAETEVSTRFPVRDLNSFDDRHLLLRVPDVAGFSRISSTRYPDEIVYPLHLAVAQIYDDYAALIRDDGVEFRIDLTWYAGEGGWSYINRLNAILASDLESGTVAWKVSWEPEVEERRPANIAIITEHLRVYCSSVAMDTENHQLVAATLVSTEAQSFRAVMAMLATNSRQTFSIAVGSKSNFMENTKKGYTSVSGNFLKEGAEGHIVTILHPLAGDPSEVGGDYFYLVNTNEKTLELEFFIKLSVAIAWPILQAWAHDLLLAGIDTGLVIPLECIGPDFKKAYRVMRNSEKWGAIISTGVKTRGLTWPVK